jgi:hypothetical protein
MSMGTNPDNPDNGRFVRTVRVQQPGQTDIGHEVSVRVRQDDPPLVCGGMRIALGSGWFSWLPFTRRSGPGLTGQMH